MHATCRSKSRLGLTTSILLHLLVGSRGRVVPDHRGMWRARRPEEPCMNRVSVCIASSR